jgi:pimeloyl-[acyl-carrier protein] methyl ester esterase
MSQATSDLPLFAQQIPGTVTTSPSPCGTANANYSTALVLLPGMDGTGELFGPLLEALPLELAVTVVAYPDRAATYDEHVAVARAELPRGRPFVVLGESFSGPVAVRLAAAAPPGLRGVILCASFLSCPNRALGLLRSLTPVASPKLLPTFIAQASLLGRFATPALRSMQTRALGHVSSSTLTARLRAMADVDVRDELRSLAVPTLYLQATEDRIVDARFGAEYAACARQPAVESIEGPHLLLQSNPSATAAAILSFIAKTG